MYCGPPMETDAGWPVLTHGVGPMRTYRIGAILLDLDNPKRILGQLRQQLLSPAPAEQDGYLPSVFYSCDALVHAETMVLTYGTGDAAIGVATVSLPELVDALSPSPTRPRRMPTLCVNNVDMGFQQGAYWRSSPETAAGGYADSPRDQWISVLSPHYRVQTTARRRRVGTRDTYVCPPLPRDHDHDEEV